ncbi:hypothetical protein [Neobacillus sp. PS2-9]|uniref:hypothetical protein n=1 Tax=Neobacillus sp. PS2-9 TaxID=3070676 RepID=UPI0027DF05EB|nr:hypothetical protein [Neobacillus sp. PS2-9]WML56660.1 hypothetical protein RCG25_17220 [Neobacillus sp. PS2-9]
MRFSLELSLDIEGNSTYVRGEFTANSRTNIPSVAYEQIKKIKRETGYRDTKIEKVVVDQEHDITEQVRAIDNRPIEGLGVFW